MLAEQVLALIIFISMFVLIVLDKIERHYVTLGCGALTLIGVFGIISTRLDKNREPRNSTSARMQYKMG